MEIELPNGCNIINSANSFYNYTNNDYTRALFYIYDGQAIKSSETTSTRKYEYTGTCLETGDIKYKPETEVYFGIIAIISVMAIFWSVWRLLFKRLIK